MKVIYLYNLINSRIFVIIINVAIRVTFQRSNMNNKDDKITDIEPLLTDSLCESITRAVSITAEYSNMFCESCIPMIENMIEPMNHLTQGVLDSVNYLVNSTALVSIVNQSISAIVDNANLSSAMLNLLDFYNDAHLQEMIHNISEGYLELFTGYGDIIERLDSLSEDEIERILEGTDYSTEDVLEGIKDLKEEFVSSELEVLDEDSILLKDKWDSFLRKHPALANVIFVITMIVAVASGVLTVNDAGDLVVSKTQKVIVTMQGNEDIFFIKAESAKLYTAPSSHSTVMTNILYGEQVTLIESINLWDKVTYISQEGEEIVGWIAKRNLMTYQDYQFNSDDLYDID